jgi:hypothetical protein
MPQQLQDYLFRFPYNQQSTGGLCRVRIYQGEKNSQTVLLSELNSHVAGSIAAASDAIANLLLTRYALNPKKTRWIEHTPAEEDQPAEFGELTFAWQGGKALPDPQWRRLEAAEAEALTGETLDDLERPANETGQP